MEEEERGWRRLILWQQREEDPPFIPLYFHRKKLRDQGPTNQSTVQ